MKKLIALLLALVCIVLAVSACTRDGKTEETTAKDAQTTTAPEEATTEGATEVVTHEDEEGKKFGEIHPAA